MPENTFKARLKSGDQQFGLWCSINDRLVVEMLAGCGYDWMVLDCEHSAIETRDIPGLLQAMAPYPVAPIVRPVSLDPAEIKKLLDFGAQTLLIPYVQSAEEAALAVRAVRYPPHGIRGVAGITRATRFGSVENYHREASGEIALIIQIETVKAVEALDDILAVEGIDGVFIGPADLGASMGHPGNPTHPDVRAACADIIGRVRRAGLPAGFLALDDTFLKEMIVAGSSFTAVAVDADLLLRSAKAKVAHWRSGAATR